MRSVDDLLEHEEVKYMLVALKQEGLDLLGRFEHADFIHAYARCDSDDDSVVKVELPRINMAFDVEDDILVSRDYRGYRLADTQKLADTLVDFDSYLVLQRIDTSLPSIKIIVQNAEVKEGVPLSLNIDTDSSSIKEAVCFDVHERFKHLQAETVQSRLFLASLYAGTDCDVSDPRLQVTGMEAALDLLRQCWINRPLTKKERS
ncbi:unnamed protein product, partial [Symbiodinium necroappetens]